MAHEKRVGARSAVCTFNLCHIIKILKNICLIMNFICCSMNQHSNTCFIRHHYPISHAQYLTHTESLKIHIRCGTAAYCSNHRLATQQLERGSSLIVFLKLIDYIVCIGKTNSSSKLVIISQHQAIVKERVHTRMIRIIEYRKYCTF